MLGHEDVGPEVKFPSRTSGIDRLNQPLTNAVFFEKPEATITTESEFVGVAGFVDVSSMHG